MPDNEKSKINALQAYNNLARFLEKHLTEDARRSILQSAFSDEGDLYYQIALQGSPREFTSRVLGIIFLYKDIEGEPALFRLLDAINVGADGREKIKAFKTIFADETIRKQVLPAKVGCPKIADRDERLDYFYGREKEHQQIVAYLKDEKNLSPVVIHSMGGLGKSTLAQYVCDDDAIKVHFGAILWVSFGESPNILSIFQSWSDSFLSKIKFDPAMNIENVARSIQHQFESEVVPRCGRILLVVDNVWKTGVEGFKYLQIALPEQSKILVTTRDRQLIRNANLITLKPLIDDAALKTIQQQVVRDFVTEAQYTRLVLLMRGHPLALNIASASMNVCENAGEIDDLLDEYETGIAAGTGYDVLDGEDVPDNLMVTFDRSYNDLSPELQRCFRYLGILVPDTPIELSLLAYVWGVDEDEKEATTLAKKLRVRSLISYMQTDPDKPEIPENMYTQHALLRSYACSKINDSEENAVYRRYLAGVKEQAEVFSEVPPEQWSQLRPLISHLWFTGDELVDKYYENPLDWQDEALKFACQIYNYLYHRREIIIDKPKRLKWLEMGLEAAEDLKKQQQIGLFANELGLLHAGFGRKHIAINYYEQALNALQKVEDQGNIATTLTNLGATYYRLGKYERALNYLQRAYPIHVRNANFEMQATTLNNLGMVYGSLERVMNFRSRERCHRR